jgi:hypothetical protein
MMRNNLASIFVLVEIPQGRGRQADLGVDRRIISKWILKQYNVKVCNGFDWLRSEVRDRLL